MALSFRRENDTELRPRLVVWLIKALGGPARGAARDPARLAVDAGGTNVTVEMSGERRGCCRRHRQGSAAEAKGPA